MPGNGKYTVATHFGRQLKKERLARGWSLRELEARMGIAAGHLSRIENGLRPPTEMLAARCDELFPERRGWFTDWYDESRLWAEVPAGFRSWSEIEDRARSLRVWSPSVVDGLLQTETYAAALLATAPKVTDETRRARLTNRMERQRRVLKRDNPPDVWFIVDEFALYRLVGSPEIMAGQMRHLATAAAMPGVTVQVMPAVAHAANASGFIVADDSAWCEHAAAGYVFTDEETFMSLAGRFASLQAECYRASESLAMIERLARHGRVA